MRAALWALRSELFVFGIVGLSWPGVWRTEGEVLAGGGANANSVWGEDNSVYGSVESWALYIVLELVAATLGGASELAAAALGLGSPRRDPRVAPGAKHAGGNGWGGGFGDIKSP